MKDKKPKATIKLIKKDQPKDKTIYVEDLLKQETFTLEELFTATHKHPIRHWFNKQKFLLMDQIETVMIKTKLWFARF